MATYDTEQKQTTLRIRASQHFRFRLSLSNAVLLVALCGGLGVRLYRLDQRSIWFDEASSWRTSQFPLSEMLDRIAANCHPPFYYLCLKAWTSVFGDSIWALRGLSVVLAGVLMVATYVFVRALHEENQDSSRGVWPGTVAALLVAVSAFQIRMSWEARMYMLGTVLAVASSWLLLLAWRRRDSMRLWSAYGLAVLLFSFTHYYALFTIFAQFLFLLIAMVVDHWPRLRNLVRDRRPRGACVSALVIAAGWIPWLPVFLAQREQIQTGWWTGRFSFWGFLSVSHSLFLGEGGSGWPAVAATAALALIPLFLLHRAGLRDYYLMLLIVCPFALSALYSVLFRNIVVNRYFSFTQVFLICGAATLLYRIKDAAIRNVVVALLVLNAMAAYYQMWTQLDIPNRPGARGAAQHIIEQSRLGDRVIASSPLIYYPMLFYLGEHIDCRVVRNENLSHFDGGPFAKAEDFIQSKDLDKLAGERLWLITGGWSDRHVPIPAHWSLVATDAFREVHGFQGTIYVHLYLINSTTTGRGPLVKDSDTTERVGRSTSAQP